MKAARRIKAFPVLCLAGALVAACQSPASEQATHGPSAARPPHNPAAALPPTGPAAQPTPKPAPPVAAPYHEPDSLRAFVGVRPLRFRCVSDDSLRAEMARQPWGIDTVFGRYLRISRLFEPTRVLYRATPAATCWTQVQLEPVGDTGAVGGEFTLDTVLLDPQRRVLLLNLRGHNGFWGGSLDYGLTNIIDVTEKPFLLLKTEALREDTSYGREDDTTYDDDAAGSESRSQTVRVRAGLIRVEQPRLTSRVGRGGEDVRSREPLPETMLPAGHYRYRGGKVFRVRK